MLRHRVQALVKRATVACPPPLPPERVKRITLPASDREEMPPGRYRLSDCCELIIVPAYAGDLDAAADATAEGPPCG